MGWMVLMAMIALAGGAGALEPVKPPPAPEAQLMPAGNAGGSIAGGQAGNAGQDAAVALARAAEDTNSTVITSTRLTFDQQKRQAVFEEKVVVTDREVKIMSDRLEVSFTEDNKVDRIEAEGHVTIVRNDLTATGEKAVYDMQAGKMQLTGHPRVQRSQDALTGETITLWRNSRRILCEPNARLVIVSDNDINRSFDE